MKALALIFRRELALAWSGGGGPLLAIAFYVAVATLVPLSTDPSVHNLAGIATGVAWVALALASLLSLERMFERDFEDGALDLLMLGPAPAEAVAAAKPLILATAAIGGIAFAFVGGTGAALALGSRRGGMIIAVIVLPLLSPPVIFGGGALTAYAAGLPWQNGLMLLGAYALGAAAICPFFMAAACRNALS